MEIREALLLVSEQRKLADLADVVSKNLVDLQQWIGRAPNFSTSLKDVWEWMKVYEDWAAKFKERKAMLLELDAILNREGFDRWTKSPEDGGIPF
jgi:hypothetical protein